MHRLVSLWTTHASPSWLQLGIVHCALRQVSKSLAQANAPGWLFAALLISANVVWTPASEAAPPNPYVVDASKQVVGRFYPNAIDYGSTSGFVILALKPSGTVVNIIVGKQGFTKAPYFLLYATTDCTGPAYMFADFGLAIRAFRVGDQILYAAPLNKREQLSPMSYLEGPNGTCTKGNYRSGRYVPALVADVAAQGFTPPFSFQFR